MRYRTPLALSAACVALVAPAYAQEDYKPHFEAGRAAFAAKEFEKAIREYTEVLRINSRVPGAFANRGLAYSRLRKWPEAIADYTKCIELCGSDSRFQSMKAQALTNRGDIYWQQEKLDQALADADAAIGAEETYPYGHRLRACIWYDLGDYDKAVASFDRAKSLKADIAPLALTREGAETRARLRSNDPKALVEAARTALMQARGRTTALLAKNADYETAVKALDRATELDPKYAPAWHLRGEAEEFDSAGMRLGANAKALPFYDKAIAADPRYAEAYLRRGLLRTRLLLFGKERDEARRLAAADLDQAIQLGVKDPAAYFERGKARDEGGDSAGAVADFTAALRQGADEIQVREARARAYERRKEWLKGIEDRSRLIALKPSDSAYARRADDYVELKDWASAQADYAKAIELDPEDPDHLLGRARMYRLAGQKAKASADYAAARRLEAAIPAVSADLSNAAAAEKERFNLGRALRRVTESGQRLRESQAALDRAEKRKKKSEERLRRALVGDTRTDEQKLSEIARDIADEIADEEDYFDRARIYAAQSKLDEAIADCEKAIQIKADYALAYNLRGICYETQKALDKAFADYDKAVSLDPKNDAFVRNRGDIWWARDNFEAAWKDYDRAVSLGPRNALNFFKRANAHYARRQYEEAIADYDRALALKPDFAQARRNREIAVQRKAGR